MFTPFKLVIMVHPVLLQNDLSLINQKLWKKVHTEHAFLGTLWIMFCEAEFSNILQSSSFEDDFGVFIILVGIDSLKIIYRIIKVYFGSNPYQWHSRIKNRNVIVSMFTIENEFSTLQLVYEVILAEFVEFVISTLYGISVMVISFSQNST